MANVNLYIKFDYTDADGNVYSDGSTTTAKIISIDGGEIFDRTYKIASGDNDPGGGTEVINDAMISDFDFLWIESDQAGEIQIVCNEGGTTGGSNLEAGMVFAITAGVPFILSNDDSRNHAGATTNIDAWIANWTADTIDRISWYHTTGSDAKVRVVAIT